MLVLLAIFSCGPSGGEHHGMGGHGAFGMHRLAAPLMHHALRMGLRNTRPRGFRRACMEDVAKLCPNIDQRRDQRECLEGKRAQLDTECREALDARRDRAGERDRDDTR